MNSAGQKTILLVDGHPIWRQGMATILSQEPGLAVCGQVSSPTVALDLMGPLRPDLILLDVAEEAGGAVELVRMFLSRDATVAVLVVSLHDERLYAERLVRAGARGYVMKQEPAEVLLLAIRAVLRGGVYLSSRMRRQLLPAARPAAADAVRAAWNSLTDRELMVFTLLGEGRGPREIAAHMRVSVRTVDAYRAHLKHKLRLRSGAELLRLAVLHAQPYQGAARPELLG